MTAADVVRVAAIEAVSLPTPWSEAAFRHELDVPFSRALVAHPADDPTEVAGYVVLWRVADEIHLLDLAVAPDFRGQGIGRLLAGRVLEEARSSGARLTTLEVAEENTAARRLYESLGFVATRVRQDYYGSGQAALVMERCVLDDSDETPF
jgi:ribosomal-protein-alanine N-acetyltransferase